MDPDDTQQDDSNDGSRFDEFIGELYDTPGYDDRSDE
jgi:hypothetical protein